MIVYVQPTDICSSHAHPLISSLSHLPTFSGYRRVFIRGMAQATHSALLLAFQPFATRVMLHVFSCRTGLQLHIATRRGQTTVDHATSRSVWTATGSSKVRHAGTKASQTWLLRGDPNTQNHYLRFLLAKAGEGFSLGHIFWGLLIDCLS